MICLHTLKKQAFIILMCLISAINAFNQQYETCRSGDACVSYDLTTHSWTFGTKMLTQVLQLSEGHFVLKQLKNNFTQTDYIGSAISDEFSQIKVG
jgi:hypothetical protein